MEVVALLRPGSHVLGQQVGCGGVCPRNGGRWGGGTHNKGQQPCGV